MKKSFVLSALVLVGFTSVAHASFEMMLAADSNGRVHRYDPENNVYLGSFGNFQVTSASNIAADAGTGIAFISDGSTIHRMNYYTGAYLGSFNWSGVTSLDVMSSGNLLIASGNAFRILDPTSGAVLQTISAGGVAIASKAVELADGSIYGLGYSFGATDYQYFALRYASASSSPAFQSLGLISYSNPNSLPSGFGEFRGDSAVSWASFSNNFAPANLYRFDPFGATTLINASLSSQEMANSAGMTHSGAMITLGSRGTSGSYSHYLNFMTPNNPNVWQTSSTVAFSSNAAIRSVAVVTAPEPASMIALGASCLGLMLRKRKRK